MDSLMFTFSADQTCLQEAIGRKEAESTSKNFRRRPSSSKTSIYQKAKVSVNPDQLFENCDHDNRGMESTPSKNLSHLKLKNSSIQIQQKRKLRNIIDNMLGKNFDTVHTHKLDSIVVSNRKNINKHRTYLNATKNHQEQPISSHDNSQKQNQLNSQNIVSRSQSQNENHSAHDKKIKIKLKKFEFANIKISKMTNHSQRYCDISRDQNTQNCQKKLVNISRESLDRESLGKKQLRSKTPKIMYPESDSKLPSVFKNPRMRSSLGESINKRSRINSANFISEAGKHIKEDEILIKKKKTLENPPAIDPSLKVNFRPQSTMLSNKRCSSSTERQQGLNYTYRPKRLIFDCNQDLLGERISKKLGPNLLETKSSGLRATTRAKSTHVTYMHRKLKQINVLMEQPGICENEQKSCVKNQSLHSRETAEASDFQESTQKTLANLSDKMTKSTEQKQVPFIGGLSNCVTFQIQNV